MRLGLLLALAPILVAQGGGAVEGTVVENVGNRGIPGVTVGLSAAGSQSVARSAITDDAGAFRIAGLPPGDYAVSFAKPGFGTAPVTAGPSTLVGPTKVHLAADGDTQRITGKLLQLGGVSGRVLDPDGQPFARLRVQLSTASQTSNTILLMATETDRDGHYQFGNMWPGVYLIEARPIEGSLRFGIASPAAKKEEEKKPPLRPPPTPEGERWMWANTYFPGALGRSQAARVVLHAGWELPGYDIRLQAVPVYRVAGVVFGEDGNRAAGVEVGMDLADWWEHDTDGAKSREDGTFEFPSVHQGDWRLTGTRQRGDAVFKGFAEVMVARHDLENLVVRLAAPFNVSGVVESDASRDPKAGPPIGRVTLESATRSASETTRPGPDGTFRIDNVYPDHYKVLLYGQASGYYAASILLGEREALGQVVELAASPPPLRVIVKPATGRVHGTVEEGGGATVVLLPKEEACSTRSSSGRWNATARAATKSAASGLETTMRWLSAAPTSSPWKTPILFAPSSVRPCPCTPTSTWCPPWRLS